MRLRLLEFLENQHMKVVMLSALYTDHRDTVRPKKISKKKNLLVHIGNRDRDFPTCSAVSEKLCHHVPHTYFVEKHKITFGIH